MNMLDDWQRVKTVFEQALAVDETDRSALLAAACGTDALLRKHVDELLASHAASQSFLETSASALLGLRGPGDDLGGQTLCTYRLLSRIGAGAMGEVYAAHDEKLNRRVAVKLIAKDLARDVDRLQRFRQEAHAASSLNHPNIVVVHDFGGQEGRPFIVTELVEGVTLRERLKEGPLSIPESIEIAVQVTSALAAAHARGLVHRDIKPENVMVRPDGYVKVLDFGLAKLARAEHAPLADATSNSLTRPGQAAGTPAYMSPEQATAGAKLTPAADLYALGLVAFRLLTGATYHGGDIIKIISQLLYEPLRLPSKSHPQLGPAFDAWFARACDRAPEKRFRSALEQVEALAVALGA
jgi:serine/threonine protein kinase